VLCPELGFERVANRYVWKYLCPLGTYSLDGKTGEVYNKSDTIRNQTVGELLQWAA
jgi:hypothetical protein